jgi:CRP-like cAMP-binding protein
MWIVIEGSAEIENSKKSESIKSGDFFGERCLLGDESAAATVKATGLLRTLRFRKNEFAEFFKWHPDCEKKVMNNLASRR